MAMRGRDRVDVLARLKFAVTGELNDEVYDTGLYAVGVDGWLVVIGDGWDFMKLIEREQAARLSDDGEVLFLYTDDTPMCAEITSFAGGNEAWSISYDGSNGVGTPTLMGHVPDRARSVLTDAQNEQEAAGGATADVDHIYDVVAKLGQKLVGFRHDETLSEGAHLPVFNLEVVHA
jgi:hypothetical protein